MIEALKVAKVSAKGGQLLGRPNFRLFWGSLLGFGDFHDRIIHSCLLTFRKTRKISKKNRKKVFLTQKKRQLFIFFEIFLPIVYRYFMENRSGPNLTNRLRYALYLPF